MREPSPAEGSSSPAGTSNAIGSENNKKSIIIKQEIFRVELILRLYKMDVFLSHPVAFLSDFEVV